MPATARAKTPKTQARYQLPEEMVEAIKIRAAKDRTPPCEVVERLLAYGLTNYNVIERAQSAVPA